jgi:hypothetical protein
VTGHAGGIHPTQGGQAHSFIARPINGDGAPCVFIKTLQRTRVNDSRARGRFKREVTAYETLAGLGPPTLIDHNAETWLDRGTPMYMVVLAVSWDDDHWVAIRH